MRWIYALGLYIEYTELGADEELRMGEEFQSLVNCFVDAEDESNPVGKARIVVKELQWVPFKFHKIFPQWNVL